MNEDIEAQLMSRIQASGLMPYLNLEKSHVLELPDGNFVELVTDDGGKLPAFQELISEFGKQDSFSSIVRAIWRVDEVGDPVQAYSPETGTPRTSMQFPVQLKSGDADCRVWVEVTYLASQTFAAQGLDIKCKKEIVGDYVESQLKHGGPSYWDPERFPHLEINSDTASYITSRMAIRH